MGASESIELITDSASLINDYDLESILSIADERLCLRGVVGGENKTEAGVLGDLGWDLRYNNVSPTLTGIIIDSKYAVFKTSLLGDNQEIYGSDNPVVVNATQRHFEHIWDKSVELLYENLLISSIPDKESSIFQFSNDNWNNVIQNLLQQPYDIYKLNPRNFEELVAELLSRQGFRIQLTPKTRDGGRDIIAKKDSTFGEQLYLVECKRYSPNRPVGVGLIRALYGVVEAERATAGLLVTTSSFSNDALKFRENIKHRISLTDYNNLLEWLRYINK